MTASIISLRWKHLRLKTRWHLSYRQARHPKDGKQLLWPFARFQKYVNDAYAPLPAKPRGKRANHPSNRFCSTADQRPNAARYRWNNFFNRASRSPQYFLQHTADTAVDFLPLLLFAAAGISFDFFHINPLCHNHPFFRRHIRLEHTFSSKKFSKAAFGRTASAS